MEINAIYYFDHVAAIVKFTVSREHSDHQNSFFIQFLTWITNLMFI